MTATPRTAAHPVVSPDRWLAERKALLAREKELTRLQDQIAEARRALPWVRIQKNYVFDTPEGPRTLAELFEGRRQLIVQHFMLGPDWEQGCPSCTSFVNALGDLSLLNRRDTTFVLVSRAPLPKQTGGVHEDKSKRPFRKEKHKKKWAED